MTGFHRKHAIRVLNHTSRELAAGLERPPRNRVYNEAVREALMSLWEAADRICAKRLKQIAPVLLEAMERHGHIRLDPEIRSRVLAISAATMDRLLRPIRERGTQGRRRNAVSTALRKSVPVRTSGGWNDPEPGFFEMDFVAHCGNSGLRLSPSQSRPDRYSVGMDRGRGDVRGSNHWWSRRCSRSGHGCRL